MTEREKKEAIRPKKVLVCNAKLVWEPDGFPNEDCILVSDTRRAGCCLTNLEFASFEEIAEELLELGKDFEIIYEPETTTEIVWVDGYFGRPLVPAEVYSLSKLNQEQVNELEAHLARLRK